MKKQKVNYSFDSKNFYDLPYEKYDTNFTFIVDGKRYQTSRIKADILSPFIRNAHFTDVSMNEFTINTNKNDKSDNTDYFNNFLNIVNSPKLKLDFLHQVHFAEYFYLLGNIDESIRLRLSIVNDLTINNAVSRLLYIIDKYECFHFDLDNERSPIKKIVDYIASHFEDIDREKLKKLPIAIIEDIFQSEFLNIFDYDSISTFILELFELDNQYSPLFEYIPFDKISDGVLDWFLEVFDIKYINKSIWNSLNLLIKFLIKQKKSLNENHYLNFNKVHYPRQNYFLSESDHAIPFGRFANRNEPNINNNDIHDYENKENDDDDEYNEHNNEELENEEDENNYHENEEDENNDHENEEEENNDHENEEDENNYHENEDDENNDHENEEDGNNYHENEDDENNYHENEEEENNDNSDIYENINENEEYNNHENDDDILKYTDEHDDKYKNSIKVQKNESGEANNYDGKFDKFKNYIDSDDDNNNNNDNDNNFTSDKTNSFNHKEIQNIMNLRDLILLEYQYKNAPVEWTFQKKYQVLYAIAIELETINKHKINHRIVKPELIYLNENYEPQLQSLNLNDDEKDEYYEKDNVFLAPEILDGIEANEKRDVYSFAINTYFMFTGRCPFDGMDIKIFVEYVKNDNRDAIPENIPNLIRVLIENCWKTNPDSRFSFLEIINFMKNAARNIDEIETEEFESYIKKFDKNESEDTNEED